MTYPRITVIATVALGLLIPAGAQGATAHQSYERIWHQDARFYAPGMPSPLVTFNARTPGAQADTAFAPGQPRLVEVSRGATRGLRIGSESAREVIEWEWARVFGDPDQGDSYPRPVTNALLRYRNGHGSPVAAIRPHLPHWGENPRTLADPLPAPSCAPGWHPAPDANGCVY